MDERTQQTLDTLADIFLTNSPSLPAEPAPAPRQPLVDQLEAARPVRLPPKLTPAPRPSVPPTAPRLVSPSTSAPAFTTASASPRSSPSSPSVSAFRTPAAPPLQMKAHPDASSAAHAKAAAPRVRSDDESSDQLVELRTRLRIETLLLGNLPGFAGPWLTQYAHQLAQQLGPVVLLHLDDEAIDVELIGSATSPDLIRFSSVEGDAADEVSPQEQLPQNLRPAARRARQQRSASLRAALGMDTSDAAPDSDQDDLIELLHDLLEDASLSVGALLLHPHTTSPGDEMLRELMRRSHRLTLLTGGDDAAVVGAYRLLKQVHQLRCDLSNQPDANEAHAGREMSALRGDLGLAVMGSDAQHAQEVLTRINATATDFLKWPLQLVHHQARMVPVDVQAMGSFHQLRRWWPHLMHWLSDITQTAYVPAGSPSAWLRAAVVNASPAPAHASPPPPTPPLSAPVNAQPAAVRESAMSHADASSSTPVAAPASNTSGALREQARALDEQILSETRPPVAPSVAPSGTSTLSASSAALVSPAAASTVEPAPAELRTSAAPAASSAVVTPSTPPTVTPSATIHSPQAPLSTPQAQPTPTHTAALPKVDEPDLAGFIPGALTLQVRPPRQPSVQLVLDAQGQLHLLQRQPAHATPAVSDLLEARQWAIEHWPLLNLAYAQGRFTAAPACHLHLFSDQARQAAQLASNLRDTLHVHLLQRITLGTQSAYACTELT